MFSWGCAHDRGSGDGGLLTEHAAGAEDQPRRPAAHPQRELPLFRPLGGPQSIQRRRNWPGAKVLRPGN